MVTGKPLLVETVRSQRHRASLAVESIETLSKTVAWAGPAADCGLLRAVLEESAGRGRREAHYAGREDVFSPYKRLHRLSISKKEIERA